MAFCRKMHHPVYVVFRKNLLYRFLIADIRLNKGIILSAFHFLQVFQITGIGKGIHIDNTAFLSVFTEHIMNIIGTDKTCAACHQIRSHHRFLLYRNNSDKPEPYNFN